MPSWREDAPQPMEYASTVLARDTTSRPAMVTKGVGDDLGSAPWWGRVLVGLAWGVSACTAAPPPPAPVVPVGEARPVAGGGPPPAAESQATPGCPTQPPKEGGACSLPTAPAGQEAFCEYGAPHRVECRTRVFCDDGRWSASIGPSDEACDEPIPTCAASLAPDETCSEAEVGDLCQREDSLCGCRLCRTPEGAATVWRCTPPPPAPCPPSVPSLGGACEASPEVQCAYGVDGTSTYWIVRCRDGAWEGHRGSPEVCTLD